MTISRKHVGSHIRKSIIVGLAAGIFTLTGCQGISGYAKACMEHYTANPPRDLISGLSDRNEEFSKAYVRKACMQLADKQTKNWGEKTADDFSPSYAFDQMFKNEYWGVRNEAKGVKY